MPPKAKAQQPEHEEEEEEEISDEVEDEETAASDNNQQAGAAAGGKKKKKKKKKTKKKAGGEADAGAAAASSAPMGPQVNKTEMEKMFNTAMASIKGNDEMWVKLNACGLQDGKAKKLFDQLKSNSSVTSLDMSQNQLTDESLQTLASTLGMNGAPELIELDLRENNFTESGLTVLDGLRKVRKTLDIKTGSIQPPDPPQGQVKQSASTSHSTASDSNSKDIRNMSRGPMFRKFFQSNDEDDDDTGAADLPEASIGPDELWAKIDRLAAEDDVRASIPALLPNLQQLALVLQRELSTLGGPNQDAMDGSRPHIKACLTQLHTLEDLVLLEPPNVGVQYSTTPQPAVGSHRVCVAEVLALLLQAGNKVIDQLLAASKLPHHLLHLALRRPLASTLHARALRMLRAMLGSRVDALASALFTPGWGAALKAEGSATDLCRPLPDMLVQLGTAAVGVASGRRSAVVGLVLEASRALEACCDEANNTYNPKVRAMLQGNSQWSKWCDADPFTGPGQLQQLCQEQEGDLGGVRPVRPIINGTSELADLAGGGLISGPEVMALLHRMKVGS